MGTIAQYYIAQTLSPAFKLTYMIRLSHFLSLLFIAFAAALFTSCNVQEKPVTKQEATEFARKLERSIAQKNGGMFNNIFDEKTLRERVKVAGAGKLGSDVLSSFGDALRKRKLGTEIIKSLGENGTFQLVKSYEKTGTQHLIFRLHDDDGLNYYDMELVHVGKEVKAADMYIYLSGENLSKTLADVYIRLFDYTESNTEQGVVKSASEIRGFIKEKKYEEALALYKALPDTLKKQKAFQLVNVEIASGMDSKLYEQAITDYENLYPNEPNMSLIALDGHFLREEFDKALEDINKVDSLINKDPFLDSYRGMIYINKSDNKKAIECFEKVYKYMPGYGAGLTQLVDLYMTEGQNKKALKLLEESKRNNNVNAQTLDDIYLMYPSLKKS